MVFKPGGGGQRGRASRLWRGERLMVLGPRKMSDLSPQMGDAVEKSILRGSPSNVDSRPRASTRS
jgi:hypothetical protein